MAVKTLLTPLKRGIPRISSRVPKRNKSAGTSFVYQDENQRYFMGTFAALSLGPDPTDTFYVLEAGDVARPDMISYKMYKTPELYWVILSVNGILDPFEGMYPGMLLRIPAMKRLIQAGISF